MFDLGHSSLNDINLTSSLPSRRCLMSVGYFPQEKASLVCRDHRGQRKAQDKDCEELDADLG